MKNWIIILIFSVSLSSCTPEMQQVLQEILLESDTVEQLTNAEVVGGLKEALVQGITKGADIVSVKDGYFKNPDIKILFPPEAAKIEQKLRDVGLGQLADNMTEKLNRAAEDAATQAKPIFKSAITNMTFNDAMNILVGGEQNAATSYLKRTTNDQLYQAFNPVVKNSLDKVKALDYWDDVITKYNKLPFVEKMNPDINDYVTLKAMDGLYTMIEKEEKLIRVDPVARTTDLLKKVFAKQDK